MELRAYIIRRLLLLIPVLIGVSLLVFGVTQLFSPVERASLYARSAKEMADVSDLVQKYGFDKPIYVQYWVWINQVIRGNLGWSKAVSMPVKDAFLQFFPATIELALFSAPFIILIGIIFGRAAAAHKDKPIDHFSRLLAIIGWSLPTFWLGLVLLMVFYGYFRGFLPPERLSTGISLYVHSPQFINYTHINTIDALLNWDGKVLLDALRHLVLPVITLTVVQMAFVMRIMRSSMLEALGKSYIIAARAKGLSEKVVISKHAQRNALIPVLTIAGYVFASLMNGVVITETVFSYKGIGWWFWQSAIQLDIPAVLGFTLFNGILFVLTNLVVDLFYAWIDPRVRLGARI